jgi:hypothetical protein
MVDVLSLEQMVNFPTWSRAVNGSFRSSILDHVYANDADKIKSVTSISVAYGDAEIMKVTVTMNYDRYIMRREYGATLVTPSDLPYGGTGTEYLGTVGGVDQGVFGNTPGFDIDIAQLGNK